MATKSSPLGDGSSGAAGNGGAGKPVQAGPMPRQQMGSCRNVDSIAEGGPALKLDPPGDRGGMVGTTADPAQRRPFKLGGEGSSSSAAPQPSADIDGEVGQVPLEDDEQ